MSAIKLFRIIRLKSHPMSIIRKKSHNSSHFGQCTTSQIDSSSKDPGTLGFEKERFFILKFTLVFFIFFLWYSMFLHQRYHLSLLYHCIIMYKETMIYFLKNQIVSSPVYFPNYFKL